ncbi:ATP-binding cassette domain-containing protein [Mesorhizobium atlanticum]
MAGEIAIDGKAGSITSFRKAVAGGIAYLPRDRRSTGIFPTQSVLDNFAISTVSNDRRFGLLSFAARRRRYEPHRQRLSIVAPRPDAAITTLSGGNQQKVLLARALALEPNFLCSTIRRAASTWRPGTSFMTSSAALPPRAWRW